MRRYFDLSLETPLGQAVRVPSDDETLPNGFYGSRWAWWQSYDRQSNQNASMQTNLGQHQINGYNIDRRTNASIDNFETHVTVIGPEISLDLGEIYLVEQDAIDTYVDLKGLPEGPSKGMVGRPIGDLLKFEGAFGYLNDQIIDIVFPEDDEIIRFWMTRIPWKYRGKGKG